MNACTPQDLELFSIPYRDKQLAKPNSWDEKALSISIFSTMKFLDIGSEKISTFLLQMADFIQNRKLISNTEKDILVFPNFGQAAWFFISSIYKAG